MPNVAAWSYSRMKKFETCPKQYYHVDVLKEHPFKETDATRYGKEFHTAAEEFIKNDAPIPDKFSCYAPLLQSLKDKPGDKHCELKLGVTEGLEPCGFFDKRVWMRGVVDLLIVDGDTGYVVDYKTSKSSRYADADQLELMALATFVHFPNVQKIHAGLVFVVADDFVKQTYEPESAEARWGEWHKRYAALETAHETGVFNPRPSGLCRAHCPVLECPHNGQNS